VTAFAAARAQVAWLDTTLNASLFDQEGCDESA
jgi:hypothetical protein